MTTPEKLIRHATASDVVAIVELLHQLKRVEGGESEASDASIGAALFAENRNVNLRALVAVDAAKVIGVALYYPGYDVLSASEGYHLTDFIVDEAYRTTGVGKLLFAHLAQENLAAGGQWVSLTVLRKNKAAQGFYAALGMTRVEVDFYAIGPIRLADCAAILR